MENRKLTSEEHKSFIFLVEKFMGSPSGVQDSSSYQKALNYINKEKSVSVDIRNLMCNVLNMAVRLKERGNKDDNERYQIALGCLKENGVVEK
jgi:hypothetical protein